MNVKSCKNNVISCVCVCVTHTYRRPKKLVLLSEVTDAGLGTLSLPKEGCDLQEILLTLHSADVIERNVSVKAFLPLSGHNLSLCHTGQTSCIEKYVVFFLATNLWGVVYIMLSRLGSWTRKGTSVCRPVTRLCLPL